MVQKAPVVVKVQQVRGVGGMDFQLNERDRAEELYLAACPSRLALFCSYSSVFISFTSVGRHFPKNMTLQSENPSR